MSNNQDLQLGIDARRAKVGAAQYVGVLNSIKAALDGLERTSSGAFATLKKGLQVTPGKGAESALNGTAKAATATENAAKRMATSVQNSMITATTQTAKLKAQFEAMGDTSGIQRVEAALARLKSQATQAGNTAQLGAAKADYRATITGLQSEARASQEAASAALKHAAATESLRKRHDEIFAVSKRYEASLEEIAQLENSGAISAAKAGAARAKAAAQLEAGAVATGKYGQALKVSQYHVTNFNGVIDDMSGKARRFDMRQVMIQLSQVGQQGSVTGNYLQALAVQLPDLALGFGPVGIAAGAVAGVLGTFLVGAMGKTSDESDKMKNKVHELSSALDALEGNSTASAAQIERHLKAAFGSVSGDVQALIEDLRAAEFGVISHKMRKEIESATTELTRLGGAFDVFWSDFANPGSVESGYLKQTKEIIAQSGIAYGQFQNLDAAVKKVFSAQDVTSFVENLTKARTLAAEIGGPVGDKIAAALLQAAKDGGVLNRVMADAAGATNEGANSASGLTSNIGTAADEAARLLQNLSSVPGALSVMGKSVTEQIAGIQAQNRALDMQLGKGLSAQAANRRVQLETMLSTAGARGQTLNVDQIAKEWEAINQLDAAAKKQEALRKQLNESTRTAGKSGGGRSATKVDEITRTTTALQQQNLAYQALASGIVKSDEAARLWAQAMQAGNGTIDESTKRSIQNIDAMAEASDRLKEIVSEQNNLRQNTAKNLEDGIQQGLSQALQGKGSENFAADLAQTVRAQMADALSKKIVASLGIENLFGVGGNTAAVAMTNGIITGGNIAAQTMATAISTGQATSAATSGGGGGFWSIVGGLFGFDEGVANTSRPATWQKVPQYAEGTANTSSGIPAVLHPNEAVIPLSRGRKVPVEMSGGGGEAITINGGIHTEVKVEGGDDSPENAARIAQAVRESIVGMIDNRIAESRQYGGLQNPRGGF